MLAVWRLIGKAWGASVLLEEVQSLQKHGELLLWETMACN